MSWGQLAAQGASDFGLARNLGNKIFGDPNPGGSNRTFMENQRRSDVDNTREIGRQNAFLSGVTPNQAQNYNLYQDTTFGEDTRRQNERITDTAKALGMSNWELMGQGSPSQVSAPSFGERPGNSKQFLSSQMAQDSSVMVAKIQADTSKSIAAMQAGTQLKIAGQATDSGALPKQQTALALAQKLKADEEKFLTMSQTELTRNTTLLNTVASLIAASPRETFTIDTPFGGIKQEQPKDGSAIRQFIDAATRIENLDQAKPNDQLSTLVNKMSDSELSAFKNMVITGVANTLKSIDSAGKNISKFLSVPQDNPNR